MANNRGKQRLWRGLAALTASVTALSLAGTPIINSFRTDIDKFLGTKSSKVVTDESAGKDDVYTYTSDYSNTTELVQAIADVGEQVSEEGTVLLKNDGALPLSSEEKSKLSLLGFSSYYPVLGGDMGSSLTANSGTDADTVDFVTALKAKGFSYNTSLETMYNKLLPSVATEVESWGNTITFNNITAPMIGDVFSSKEPSQDLMTKTSANWKDSLTDDNVMVVTIARSGSENRTYLPGEDGVADQGLNQSDALGLSDDERNLIQAAVDAKSTNGGKVIVLVNSSSAMEIQEIQDNTGVDAILQIGLPGGYGFYGVCDVLDGTANPSGKLADTYAADASNSPAAQNYGNYSWTNAVEEASINSEIVQAEGIYDGYKYYETRYMDSVLGQGNAASAAGSSTTGNWEYANEVTYSFGYGLSYTTFEQKLESVRVDLANKTATAEVTVTNTGSVAGKDAVELYVSTPYTDYDKANAIEKAGVQLLDFEKTGVIEAGQSETVTIEADLTYMTSWDSTSDNSAGTKGCYILDGGDYYFTIGNGSHEAADNVLAAQGKTSADGMTEDGNAENVVTWNLDKLDNTTFAYTKNGTAVENQLEDADLNYWMPGTVTYLTRADWEGTFPTTYENLTATDDMLKAMSNDTFEYGTTGSDVVFGANNGLKLADLKGVTDIADERWSLLMDQITLEECMLRMGFGGTSTKAIDSITSPETIQNDGPNGIYSYTLGTYANYDPGSGDPCAISDTDKNKDYKAGVMGSESLMGQTFNKDLVKSYGEVKGNYSLWSNLTIWWGTGVNLHRTPYNARNHEYFSEDSVLTSFLGAAEVEGAQEYGVVASPKHVAANDTEINRIGVATFMTEQKLREGELRAAQSSIEDANALGAMTAFNRIGCYTANAHSGMLLNIVRGEWGFKGLMSEDFIMDAAYAVLPDASISGVTMACNTGDNTMEALTEKYADWTLENVKNDEALTSALKRNMTWQAYALANSNAMDGYSSSTHIVSVRTWYDNLITALMTIFGILTVLNFVMYVKSSKNQ